MSQSTLSRFLTACTILIGLSTTTYGCKTTQQRANSAELASSEQSPPEKSETQSRPVSIMYAQSDDEMTCIYTIVAQILKANFNEPLSIDNHYGWRPGLLDARKYWFTIRSDKGAEYKLNLRATHSDGRCNVDLESINPLYMKNSDGYTIMSIQGQYSNSLFKALNQGAVTVGYALFWVAYEVKDALTPAPRAPSSAGAIGRGF